MSVSNPMKEVIKQYLDNRAATDELFAVTYAKANKSLDECCKYIIKQAQKGGAAGYTDEQVYEWAIHYYDEDSIKNVKATNCKVVVNREVALTEEEEKKIREKAIEKATEEKAEEIKKDLMVNVELSPEEIAKAKADAIAKVHEEARAKMEKKKVVKSKPKTTTAPALNLEADTEFKGKAIPNEIIIPAEPIVDPNGQSSLF